MLTTPDNLLFLHLLVDDLQDKLLHHLSRDGDEADRPVVPLVNESVDLGADYRSQEVIVDCEIFSILGPSVIQGPFWIATTIKHCHELTVRK